MRSLAPRQCALEFRDALIGHIYVRQIDFTQRLDALEVFKPAVGDNGAGSFAVGGPGRQAPRRRTLPT